MKPVCLVIGAGAGVGGNVGKRFAKEGYHAVLLRRTDEQGLATLVAEIENEGGSASGFLLNAVEENSIEDRIASVEEETGPIDVVVYNLGAQVGDRPLEQTSYKVFELGWRMGTFGLFRTAGRSSGLLRRPRRKRPLGAAHAELHLRAPRRNHGLYRLS